MKKPTQHIKAAFSLVELLVVIAVIAIIAAIAIPNIANITGAAGDAKDRRNAQNIASVFNASIAAGNDATYATASDAADAVIAGITVTLNDGTVSDFRVDGISTDDTTEALTYLTIQNASTAGRNTLQYSQDAAE